MKITDRQKELADWFWHTSIIELSADWHGEGVFDDDGDIIGPFISSDISACFLHMLAVESEFTWRVEDLISQDFDNTVTLTEFLQEQVKKAIEELPEESQKVFSEMREEPAKL